MIDRLEDQALVWIRLAKGVSSGLDRSLQKYDSMGSALTSFLKWLLILFH